MNQNHESLHNEIEEVKRNEQLALEEEARRVIEYFRSQADHTNIMVMMDFDLVSCDVVKREVTLRFPIKKWQMNPNHTFHGGLLATSFDIAFGVLVRILTRHDFIATVDLSVNFLRPIWLGDELIIVAKANHEGKSIVQVSAEAFVNDSMVGTSHAAFMLMKRKV